MKRNVYLEMKGVEEAGTILQGRFGGDWRTEPESVSVDESLGRVTAESVFARFSAPTYHSAAMDGIAVKAERTYGINERKPMRLALDRDAIWINTGQALTPGFDAVIMVEKLHQVDEGTLEIRSPAYPWQNVRKVGEDIVTTQLLFPQDHCIRPYDMGALVAAGIFSLKVWKKPRVVIIPTGSELLHFREIREQNQIGKDRIIEYNSLILAGMVKECGGIPEIYDIVPDEESRIREALLKAVDSDAHIVLLNAGSSAGSKDFTVRTIRELGEVLVHGVAMMPGKPTILGVVKGKPVIGNPGYTVSATLSFKQFVRPLLFRIQGRRMPREKTIRVQPSRNIPSKLGIEEFLRVNIGRVGDKTVATPLPRAAGSITTMTRSEGILRIPALSEGVGQDEEMDAELLVDEEEIRNTVSVIGSHDMTIDVIADELNKHGHTIRISSGNVGSLGGLMAIRGGICHIAGSHLLDTETGEYNLSYIRRYLKGTRVSVFHLVLRDQGLIVPKGNPQGIKGIEDLKRKDLCFVNRQAGAGTRVLLDYKLAGLGIDPKDINGYDHEEFTHMAVAVDVLSGAGDCGMGIHAAAKALDLDFVPIVQEQYDLIIPSSYLDLPNIRRVMDVIASREFKDRVVTLGGYDPSRSGEFWKELE